MEVPVCIVIQLPPGLVTKFSHRGRHHLKLSCMLLAFVNAFHAFANPETHPNMMSLVVEFDYFKNEHWKLLEQCIEVALTGKLQHLKVLNTGQHYWFPSHCLSSGLGDRLQSLAMSNCIVTTPCRFCIFRSLQKLALYGLSLLAFVQSRSQKRFQVLLDSCSSLEILSIEYSTILPLLIIDAPNQLKEVTINHCRTDSIDISHAPKLEKLECFVKCAYFGSERCKLHVATVPCLKPFRLGFDFYPYRGKGSYTLEMLTRAAPHLETLVLCFDNMIKMEHCWDSRKPPSVFLHDNLKVLKLKGFGGESMDLEMNLILFMLNSTSRLERVIISRDASLGKQWSMTEKSKIVKRLRGGTNSNPLIMFT